MNYTNIMIVCFLIFLLGMGASFGGRKIGGAIRKIIYKLRKNNMTSGFVMRKINQNMKGK